MKIPPLLQQQSDRMVSPVLKRKVTARLFMGKGRRRPSGLLEVPLSARDDEETIAKQWAALREAFLSDRQVQ